MRQFTESILSGYDAASGSTTASMSEGFAQFPLFNFLFSSYGLDAADGDIKLQGSLDNNSWFDIDNVTLAQSTEYTIQQFVSTTVMVITGNAVAKLLNNPHFYIAGSTTNDGLKTASATQLQTRIVYSSLVGVFVVGETVTGSVSAATGIIVVNGAGVMRVRSVTGTFGNTDVITGGTSAATADVDSNSIVTQITTTGLTVEAVAGQIWEGAQSTMPIPQDDTAWIYYRLAFTANSVTEGFVDAYGVAKNYFLIN